MPRTGNDLEYRFKFELEITERGAPLEFIFKYVLLASRILKWLESF